MFSLYLKDDLDDDGSVKHEALQGQQSPAPSLTTKAPPPTVRTLTTSRSMRRARWTKLGEACRAWTSGGLQGGEDADISTSADDVD